MDQDQFLQLQQFQQFMAMNSVNWNMQQTGMGMGGQNMQTMGMGGQPGVPSGYGGYGGRGYQPGVGYMGYPQQYGMGGQNMQAMGMGYEAPHPPQEPPPPPPPPPPCPVVGKGMGKGAGGKGYKGYQNNHTHYVEEERVKLDDLDEFPVLGGAKKNTGNSGVSHDLKVVHKQPVRQEYQHQQPVVPTPQRVAPPRQIVAAAWKAPPSTVRSSQKKQLPPPVAYFWYSKHLWVQAKKNLSHVQYVERVFNGLVTNSTSYKMLPPMNREKRELIHELGLYYNISVVSLDKEPNRSCYIKRTSSTHAPPQLLSAWSRTAPDPDTTAQNKLSSTPSSAIVFPNIPVSVGCAVFNTMFANAAGKWLILRRKRRHSGDGPVRAVIAVFFTQKALETALSNLQQEAFKGKYNYEWTFYENYAKIDAAEDSKLDEYSDEEDEDVEEVTGPGGSSKVMSLNEWNSKTTGPTGGKLQKQKLSDYHVTKNTFSGLKQED